MSSWDEEGFEPQALSDDEEPFVHATTPASTEAPRQNDDDDGFPVLMLDLAPLAAADEALRNEFAAVRALTLSALESDWTAKSAELMANHLCWHAPRREGTAAREAYEAAHPGSML